MACGIFVQTLLFPVLHNVINPGLPYTYAQKVPIFGAVIKDEIRINVDLFGEKKSLPQDKKPDM